MVAKDIISRDALKRLTTDLARQLLGIDGEAIDLLETQNQRIEDRRADLVARMRASDGSDFLLHAEIANNNDRTMPWRMLRYLSDIRLTAPDLPIRQFLIYIGSGALAMPSGTQEPDLLDYRYTLVDMHRINCAGLLSQDNPDALVLAVLCDFGDRSPEQLVSYIVRRLKELLGTDDKRFREYMTMLEILSENRELRDYVEEAEKMLTQVDIKRLPSYAIGFEDGALEGEARGEARGDARGEARGVARGQQEGRREIVLRLLGRLDADEVADLLGVGVEEVRQLAEPGDGNERSE